MTINPTTTIQYWAAQNDANEETAETTTTPATTTTSVPTGSPVKPSNAPTQNQCQGNPCDYEDECRSSLGFCGIGPSYCNTISSWVPSCGGGKGLIREPTASPDGGATSAPAIAWEEWNAGESGAANNETTAEAAVAGAAPNNNNTYDPAVWENWGAATKGDGTAAGAEEPSYEWWTQENSATIRGCGGTIFWTAVLLSAMTVATLP